MTKQIVTVSS